MSKRPFTEPGLPVEFNGQHFDNLWQFRQAYPAFTGDDAVRAIRSGCKTVLEVERFVWLRRNDERRKARERAQRSQFAAKHSQYGRG